MIQITAETMESLRQALKDMKDFTVTCGKADQEENQELVHIQWTEDDHNFNKGWDTSLTHGIQTKAINLSWLTSASLFTLYNIIEIISIAKTHAELIFYVIFIFLTSSVFLLLFLWITSLFPVFSVSSVLLMGSPWSPSPASKSSMAQSSKLTARWSAGQRYDTPEVQ